MTLTIGTVVVAFSRGVDSAFLAGVAQYTLGSGSRPRGHGRLLLTDMSWGWPTAPAGLVSEMDPQAARGTAGAVEDFHGNMTSGSASARSSASSNS